MPAVTATSAAPGPKPVVATLKPVTAPATGGTKVRITGKHLSGATKVLFGKAKGTKLKIKSDRKLTVVAPAHQAGVVQLKVKTPRGTSKKVPFTYVPTVTKLSPANGLSTGGARVTVTGAGFGPGATVRFGGVPGTSVVIASTTSLTVTAPPRAVGGAPVVVTSGGQTSAARTFTYLAAPTQTVAPVPGVDQSVPSQSEDVACTAPGTCVVAGTYGQGGAQRAMALTLASSTWTPTEIVLPGDVHAVSPTASLIRISCPTPTFCAAIGRYRTAGGHAALATTWNGSAWSPAVGIALPGDNNDQPYPLDLDCASATECRGVGYYLTASGARPLLITFASSTWSATSPSMPAGASSALLRQIDCPAPAECTAVGFANESGGGSVAYAETIVGGVPSAVVPTLPLDAVTGAAGASSFSAVACTAPGTCVAGGEYLAATGRKLFVGRLASSTWTVTGSALPADHSGAEAYPYVNGVACPAPGQCALSATYRNGTSQVDQQVLMGTVTGSAQSFTKLAAPVGAVADDPWIRPGAVVCGAVGRCVSVGAFADTVPTSRSYITRMSGGRWLPAEALALPALASIATLVELAADSGTTAVAVGSATVSGVQHGLLVTGVPIGP